MSFAVRNLSVLAYANGFTLWHYKAGEDAAPVAAPGYFNDSGDMLTAGDMILVSSLAGGRVLCVVRDGKYFNTAPLS